VVDDDFGSVVDPWLRHRRRMLDELGALSDEQWKAQTRCDSWDARGVISHLVTVDGFWTMVLTAALARDTPTTFIRGFDPSTGTDALIAPMIDLPPAAILEQLAGTTDRLVATVERLGPDDWSALAEAPFGHMPVRLIMGHALWDSWLHERDILVPLGLTPPVEPDELLVATWYSFVVGGLQGGLIDDPEPVGAVAEQPIDVTIRFEDLAEWPVRVEIDTGVRVTKGDASNAIAAGPALDFVESLAGRGPQHRLEVLPADLAPQMARAGEIL
jgi:uncharacterized protein (TIGR03083 family)